MVVKEVTRAALFVVLSCSATSAFVAFWLTRRAEERKILKEKKEQYERDQLIKSKSVEARKLKGEPDGRLLEDVTIERIFMLEVEDLKSRFPSSKRPNAMQNVFVPNNNPYFFPSLEKSKALGLAETAKTTSYNKLISESECILGNIVRKPDMQTYTHAYVRAGPRRYLHFDPKTVNAAIVTCGGLCPGCTFGTFPTLAWDDPIGSLCATDHASLAVALSIVRPVAQRK